MPKYRARLHDILEDTEVYIKMRNAWIKSTPFSVIVGYIMTRESMPRNKRMNEIAELYKFVTNDEREISEIVQWLLDRSIQTPKSSKT